MNDDIIGLLFNISTDQIKGGMRNIKGGQNQTDNQSHSSGALTCFELFAGAGGMSLGLRKAGFQHLGLVEWDKTSASTLRKNGKTWLGIDSQAVWECDARKISYERLLDKIDLLAGSPPCQPFSPAGNSNGHLDPRNMFPAFLDAVAGIMPKAVLIENVRGLTRQRFNDYFQYIIRRLMLPMVRKKEGDSWETHLRKLSRHTVRDFHVNESYVVHHQLLDVADYGVPQRRSRVFIMAFRRDLNIIPESLQPTHSKLALYQDQWITGDYWNRHGISRDDYLGSALPEQKNRSLEGDLKLPWRTVRDAIADLPPSVMRGQVLKFPNHVQVPGARIYGSHNGSYYDRPAKTLKAGTHGTPGGENMVRTTNQGDVRYFTTRESARLQTFDDLWEFEGVWGHCIRQLGDAVPVEIAKRFGLMIHSRLMPN